MFVYSNIPDLFLQSHKDEDVREDWKACQALCKVTTSTHSSTLCQYNWLWCSYIWGVKLTRKASMSVKILLQLWLLLLLFIIL